MRRCVPKELGYAKDDLLDFAWGNKWLLSGRYEAEPDKLKPFQLSFDKKKGQTVLNYFDDLIVGFPYYVLSGPEEDEEHEKITQAIQVYSIEEVVELFNNAQTSAERVRAILYLGVSVTGEFKEELFAEFLRAFSDPEPKVRSAAIHACTYVGWSEFRDVLENLRENDPNVVIRSEAESTFNVFAMTEEERLAFIKQRRGEE